MSKPSLKVDALAEELGAVAVFARRPKVSDGVSLTPPEPPPVEPLEGPKTAGAGLPDQDVVQSTGSPDRPSASPQSADEPLGRSSGPQDLLEEPSESAGRPPASVASPAHPSVRASVRRTTTRYAFEFYQDQVDRLRGLSLEERFRGQRGSMSEMVREAVDEYLARKGGQG